MAGVVNLRQARKRKDRARKRTDADRNAAKHGLTRTESAKIELEQEKANRTLDQHRLEGDDG